MSWHVGVIWSVGDNCPGVIGWIDETFPRRPQMAPDNNHVLVVTDFSPPQVTSIDISDPAHPTLVDQLPSTVFNNPQDAKVMGDYLYTAGGNGLGIVDVSDATNLSLVGSLNDANMSLGFGVDIHPSGNTAYYSGAGSDWLTVVNVTNKAAPVALGHTAASAAFLSGGHIAYDPTNDVVWVTARSAQNALTCVDVSSPTAPVILGTPIVDADVGEVTDVKLSGSHLFLTCSNVGGCFTVVDVSNPASPSIVAVLRDHVLVQPQGLLLSGSLAYVAATPARVAVVDISNPIAPASLSLHESIRLNGLTDLATDGLHVYGSTSMNSGKVATIDPACIDSPIGFCFSVTGTTQNPLFAGATSLVRNHSSTELYIAVPDKLLKASAFDPTTITSQIDIPDAEHVDQFTNLVVVTTTNGQVVLVDGTAMTIMDSLSSGGDELTNIQDMHMTGTAWDVAVSPSGDSLWSVAVVVTDNRLTLVDLGLSSVFPPSLTLRGSLVLTSPNRVSDFTQSDFGQYAYVTQGNSLLAINISDLDNPFVSSTLTDSSLLSGALGLTRILDWVFVAASGSNRVSVVDVSNPLDMAVIGSIQDATFLNTPTDIRAGGRGSTTVGELMVTTASGITVVDVSDATNPTISGHHPITNVTDIHAHYGGVASTVMHAATDGAITRLTSFCRGRNSGNCQEVVHDTTGLGTFGSFIVKDAVDDTIVYTNHGSTLRSWDISVPESPTQIDSITLPGGGSMLTDGTLLYVVGIGSERRFRVVDVSDPSNMAIIAVLFSNAFDNLAGITKIGDFVFTTGSQVIGGARNLISIDATTPSSPVIASLLSLPLAGTSGLVAGINDVIYLTTVSNDDIMSFDVSDPFSMSLIQTFTDADNLASSRVFSFHDDLLYLTVQGIGGRVAIVDASDPSDMQLVSISRVHSGSPRWAYLNSDEGLMWVGTHFGITLMDVSTPESPAIVSTFQDLNLATNSHTLVEIDHKIFVTGTDKLSVVDWFCS